MNKYSFFLIYQVLTISEALALKERQILLGSVALTQILFLKFAIC